jgi:hypothetical protein
MTAFSINTYNPRTLGRTITRISALRNHALNKSQIRIAAFDGGLNTKSDSVGLEDNQSPSLQNVTFDDLGAVGTRNGYTKVNTAAIGTATVDGLYSYTSEGQSPYLVAACNGSYWFLSGTTFNTIPSSQSLFSAGVNAEIRQFQNLLFVSNGVQQPYKWNRTEFTRMGVSAPTATLVAATGAVGNPNGTYTYVYTGVNSFAVESDYGVVSNSLAVVNSRIALTGIPTAPVSYGINSWNIYRNTAGVQGIYYRVTSVTNGVSAYTDNIIDASLVTAAPLDKGVPRKYQYSQTHKGYFFTNDVSNPSYLWYSVVNQPESYPSTNFIRVGYGDGKIITGIAILNDTLVITKNDAQGNGSAWVLFMTDSVGVTGPTNWYLRKSDSAYGGESHRSMVIYSNILGFLARQGFFAFSGTSLILAPSETTRGSFGVDSHSYDIEPDIFAFKTALLGNASAIQYKNKIWLSVSSTSASAANDAIYQYDFVRATSQDRTVGAWSKFSNHSIGQMAIHNGALYGGSSLADGFVYQLDSGTSDNGSAITSYYLTSPIAGEKDHVNNTKAFRIVYLLVQNTGNWMMNVTYFVDFRSETGNTIQIPLTPGGGVWASMVWGVDPWGGQNLRTRVRILLAGALGQYIQLKFSGDGIAGHSWKVYDAEIFYNVKGLR